MKKKDQSTKLNEQSAGRITSCPAQNAQNREIQLQKLLQLLEEPSSADLAIRARVKTQLLSNYDSLYPPHTNSNSSFWERLFFTRPWQVILPASLCMSIILHLVLAESFPRVVSIFLGLGVF